MVHNSGVLLSSLYCAFCREISCLTRAFLCPQPPGFTFYDDSEIFVSYWVAHKFLGGLENEMQGSPFKNKAQLQTTDQAKWGNQHALSTGRKCCHNHQGHQKSRLHSQHVFSCFSHMNCRLMQMHLTAESGSCTFILPAKRFEICIFYFGEVKSHYKRGFPKQRKATQKSMNSHEGDTRSLLWNFKF